MKKYQKFLLASIISIASLSSLYVGALFAIPKFVDLNDYKDTVIEKVEKETGLKLSCEDVSFQQSFSPYLNIKLYHTLLLYPNDEVFLKLKDAELKVKILPLLFKQVVVKDAKLIRPIINITLYSDNTTSLQKYVNLPKKNNLTNFAFNKFVSDTICERYKLKIKDEKLNKTFYLEGDKLIVKDFIPNEKIHFILDGALFENKKEYLNYNLDVTTFIPQVQQQVAFSPFKTIQDYNVKGVVDGKLSIDKNKNANGFLNVENISLNVDNLLLKDNKVNLIFKGQDVQIDSIFHTSKTDSAKVKGKFNFSKKKNINLSVDAKKINLRNLHKILTTISESINIPNKYSDVTIDGLLNANFTVNSDFKKLKSDGNATISNAKIKLKEIPFDINNVNSEINFNNNKISIEKANLNINNTPIYLTGVVDENVNVDIKAHSNNLNFNNVVELLLKEKELPVIINKGDLSFETGIKGSVKNGLKIDNKIKLNDVFLVDKKTNLPLLSKNILVNLIKEKDIFKGELIAKEIESNYNKKRIYLPELNAYFDNKKIMLPQNKLKIANSDFIIKGNIFEYLTKPKTELFVEGNILSSDFADVLKEKIAFPYKAVGSLRTKGKINFADEMADFKLQLIANQHNYLSYAIIKEVFEKPTVLNIDGSFKNNVLHLKDLSLYENVVKDENKIININGAVQNNSLKDLKVAIPRSLSFSSNYLGGEEISLNGNLNINGNVDNPKIKGNIKLFDCKLKQYLTAIKNADINLTPENIRIVAPDVQINTSKVNAFLDINPNLKDKIVVSNAQLNCINLDMNSFFNLIKDNTNPFANSKIVVKNGVATINNFQILDLKAKDISSDFSIEDNILKAKNIIAKAYNGKITGDINYDLPHGQLFIMLNGKNVDMKTSLYDLCKIDDNIAGVVDFKSNIGLTTGEYKNVIKSLNGNVYFNSYNGRMGTLGKFEYYLYAQNILYYGFMKANLNRIAEAITKTNTAQYNFAEGKLFFQNGYLMTEGIKTQGKNMSLYLKGRHNILSNQANIDIYGRISNEITNKLGSFGEVTIADLMNKEYKYSNNVMSISSKIAEEIPPLYNSYSDKTNLFKVNIFGKLDALNAINSFMWVIPKDSVKQKEVVNSTKIETAKKEVKKEELPDFSDITQNDL